MALLPRFKESHGRLPPVWEKQINSMLSQAIDSNNVRIEKEMQKLVTTLARELLSDMLEGSGSGQSSYAAPRQGGMLGSLLGNWLGSSLSFSGSQQQARSLDSMSESERRR